ncbi:MAG: DUF3047 domain-containing protein [Lentisphaeria bacterium]|nr:DUF3047 domain-containing protein [Lentisphaeria bacterium]
MMCFRNILFIFLTSLAVAVSAADGPSADCAWKEIFNDDRQFNIDWQPEGMHVFVPHTKFYVAEIPSAGNGKALVIEAARSAGARVIAPQHIDWEKTPVLRWRWRLVRPVKLKKGQKEPDDQPGVIYVGDGTLASSRCIAYRWEKTRRIGEAKWCKYAAGRIKTYAVCAANDTVPLNEWRVEEFDVVNDFIKAFGTPPKQRFMLCLGGNSQYSRSETRLEIDFIEFIPRRSGAKNE